MDLQTFIAKWTRVQLTERAAAQQHFLDLCTANAPILFFWEEIMTIRF